MSGTRSTLSTLRSTLHHKIQKLQAGYVNARTSSSLQALAALRRAPIDAPGLDPELWELTLGELPEEIQGSGDQPSRAELSIHAALVLYAVHQQSQGTPMHQPDVGLGRAVARLAMARGSASEPEPGVIRKFHRICSAQLRSSRLQELRSLMTLMRSSGIPLDHAQLGVDLFLLEGSKTRDGVILNWGRDLHRRERRDTPATDTPSTSQAQATNH